MILHQNLPLEDLPDKGPYGDYVFHLQGEEEKNV